MSNIDYKYWTTKDLIDKGIIKEVPVYEWIIDNEGNKILKLINKDERHNK